MFGFGVVDCFKDFSPCFFVVLVADDGGVELGDGGLVEFGGVFGNVFFEFDVGWFLGFDEVEKGVAIEADGVEDHLIVALAAGGVIRVEFAGGAEGGFLPEAGEVEDAEWAGGAG